MWRTGSAVQSSDGGMNKPSNGMPTFYHGSFYVLYGTPTAIGTTAAETSIFTGDTSITSPIVVQAGVNPYPSNPGSSRKITPDALNTLGTMYNLDFYGSIVTNGTPNITFQLGLVDSAGTFKALATTGATALASQASATYLHIKGGLSVAKVGSAGTTNAFVGIEYAPTAVSIFSTVTNTTSVDLTKPYTLDVRVTWGTSDAANIVTVNYGAFEVIG
jgi:hypothetical protein